MEEQQFVIGGTRLCFPCNNLLGAQQLKTQVLVKLNEKRNNIGTRIKSVGSSTCLNGTNKSKS